MIYLTTGLPGAGKTLFTLYHVKREAEKDQRQVYFFNIPECKVPGWVEIDEDQFKKWYELPPGSIIVGDEVQRVFRPRASHAAVPEYVSKLETHRHLGLDLYFVTQHPGLIDLNVRKLVGYHRHVVRAFGAKHAVVHSWNHCKDNCDKSRRDSVKSQFKYPKEVFTWYKSAEQHTHKLQLPWRVVFLIVAPFIVLGAGYMAFKGLTVDNVAAQKAAVEKSLGREPGSLGSSGPGPGPAAQAKPMTKDEYIASLTPRIPDFPHTAPRYDQITQPIDAPYPVGCYTIGDKCKCVSQQGTPIKTSSETCQNIVQNGYFKDWLPPAQSQLPAPRQEQQAPAQPDPAQV